MNFVDIDQTLPVLEGFIVDVQEDNGKVKIAGASDGIHFKFNLLAHNHSLQTPAKSAHGLVMTNSTTPIAFPDAKGKLVLLLILKNGDCNDKYFAQSMCRHLIV